jgi:hypothetical protein
LVFHLVLEESLMSLICISTSIGARLITVVVDSALDVGPDHRSHLINDSLGRVFVKSSLCCDHLGLALLAFDHFYFTFRLDDACKNLVLDILARLLQGATYVGIGEAGKIL